MSIYFGGEDRVKVRVLRVVWGKIPCFSLDENLMFAKLSKVMNNNLEEWLHFRYATQNC